MAAKRKRREPHAMGASLRAVATDATAEQVAEDLDAEEQEWREEMLRQRWAHEKASRLRNAGLPPRWADASFDSLDVSENTVRAKALRAAAEWAAGRLASPGLMLTGPIGIGKTRIAATAAAVYTGTGPVRWLSVADALLKLAMDFSAPERAAVLRKLSDPSPRTALVLDDLDKSRSTEHAVQPLYVAINAWVDAGAPLLVTTNKVLDELADELGERYGDPIASRLAGHCEVFEMSGRDRRIEP